MMADTKVTAKPNTSRLIQISLCLKLTTGGLVIAFFGPRGFLGVRGLRSGLTSGLVFVGLRSGLALSLGFTGLRSGLASGLTFTGLSSELALGLTLTGFGGATGSFIRKSIEV
ncbi:MAG: hypothetical protein WCH01_19185 [Methylococcaceae bacterium]